jgi:DNA-binding IclR family transcriptional regulator
MTSHSKPATTVTKVCRILDELASHEGLGISDLSRRTALLPSDVHRILAALRINGYVGQDTETKKYQLGVQVLRLGLEACQRNELYEQAHPIVTELSQQIGATTHLAAFDRRELDVFLIADVNGPAKSRSMGRLGGLEFLHSSALGKVIVSGLEWSTAARAVEKGGLTRNTRRTITDLGALERHLEQVRMQGYAVDREECFDGLCCLGCPIIDWTGEAIGSVSTSMPAAQFVKRDETLLAASLKAAARRISAALAAALYQGAAMPSGTLSDR